MSIGIIRTLFYEKIRTPEPGKNSICLFLGAGADISSGGRTFTDLKMDCLKEFSEVSLPSLFSPERVDEHFNGFFDKLESKKLRASVIEFLFHGMDEIRPSDGYKLLVLLAKVGVIDSVVTTNFDTVLEAAQRDLGLDVFQIYAQGVASPCLAGKRLLLPPRPPYVKLHGDIKAKHITHLTVGEIKEKPYDRSFSLLLQKILTTHTIIFIGYSGSDEAFAREMAKASAKTPRPVYWCNLAPLMNDSPLALALQGGELIQIKATFEEILSEASLYSLRNLTLLEAKPHFLLPLLKDRIHCANEQFISSYAYKEGSTRLSLLQARQTTLDQVAAFRFNSERPLAVLTGLSGVGKTTLLCQLYDAEEPAPLPRLLLLRARGITTTDFAEELSVRLGYAADNPLALLYELSAWLRSNGQQLLVAVDGLNEFAWSSVRCLDLFKEILRVALWIQPHNSLKLLITMRPETWNELYSVLDHADLKKVLWNESEFQDDLRAIHLARFSSEEMAAAYNSYARHFGVTTPLRQLPDETKKQLADPYYLDLALKHGGNVDPDRASFHLYGQAFDDALERSFGRGKAQSLDNGLLRLASLGLSNRITVFELSTLESLGLRHEELRVLREIPILQKSGKTTYSFVHDRVHEYYLARAISEFSLVQVRDWTELTKAVEQARSYPRLAAALLQCIVHSPQVRREYYLKTILDSLMSRSVSLPSSHHPVDEHTIDFCKNVFSVLADEYPEDFCEVVNSYLDRQVLSDEKNVLCHLLIRASSTLPLQLALPLFLRARKTLTAEAKHEVDIFLYDKVSESLLDSPIAGYLTRFDSGPLSEFIFEPGIERWQSALRLLGIITKLGPDNTHPDEWKYLSAAISEQLERIFSAYKLPKSAEADLADIVLRNSNTLLFNAGPSVIEGYFMADSRRDMGEVLKEINEGHPLSLEQVSRFRKYVQQLDQNVEFVIANLFFVISMKLDCASTLQLFADYYDLFDRWTTTEELDFFLSALCLSHLALGRPCQTLVTSYTERMIVELPQISLGYPGAARGERRALFTDPFDQQFEDGFNPLAFYFYNAPSELRRLHRYPEYLRFTHESYDCVPLYWRFLEQFEAQQNTVGVVRIIHALGQMIGLWPIEGLIAIEKLVGRTDPTVRRATIRVLAEANARFPVETSLMMSRAGSGFTEVERRQIQWSEDSHMAYRALEQLHWARVICFLDQRDTSGRALNKIADALVTSFSLPEAMGRIMNEVVIGRS
jgi:hypothetical protein